MYKEIALGIIREAVVDIKNNKQYKAKSSIREQENNKISAKTFFKSDWFYFLCYCCNINSRMILERLKEYL